MIIKILSSARNFEGIDYSERKNDQGKSRLLVAKNFGALGHQEGKVTKADYINYMKLVSDANPRVKKRQFHAVLSAKNRSYTPDELASIAEQYLNSMGYGDNPYLIYFHKDTQNNHVHLVSTRVDKNGKKVKDSYEKIRSQKVLQQILQNDPKMEAKAAISEAFEYAFSTEAQFKLLLEQCGYKFSEHGNKLRLIKYGIIQGEISKDQLAPKIAGYQPPEDRIRQLKAIFQKYKKGMDFEVFCNKMHSKFGLNLILHKNNNYNQPYGYTIIDHSKKQVFKGSQIMPLNFLLRPVTKEESIHLLENYFEKLDAKTKSFSELKNKLNSMGFHLNVSGEISGSCHSEKLYEIPADILEILKYNNRLKTAQKYSIDNQAIRKILSELYHVNLDDLHVIPKPKKDRRTYYHELLFNAGQNGSLNEMLKARELEILKQDGFYFLWDKAGHYIIGINQLLENKSISLSNVEVREVSQAAHNDRRLITQPTNSLSKIAPLFDLAITGENQNNSQKRSKRKARKF